MLVQPHRLDPHLMAKSKYSSLKHAEIEGDGFFFVPFLDGGSVSWVGGELEICMLQLSLPKQIP